MDLGPVTGLLQNLQQVFDILVIPLLLLRPCGGAKYREQRVSMSVCVSACSRISKIKFNTLRNYL